MAELPATGSLGTGQLDTRDLLVAGVPISILSKYLYLYLELSGSTVKRNVYLKIVVQRHGFENEFYFTSTVEIISIVFYHKESY